MMNVAGLEASMAAWKTVNALVVSCTEALGGGEDDEKLGWGCGAAAILQGVEGPGDMPVLQAARVGVHACVDEVERQEKALAMAKAEAKEAREAAANAEKEAKEANAKEAAKRKFAQLKEQQKAMRRIAELERRKEFLQKGQERDGALEELKTWRMDRQAEWEEEHGAGMEAEGAGQGSIVGRLGKANNGGGTGADGGGMAAGNSGILGRLGGAVLHSRWVVEGSRQIKTDRHRHRTPHPPLHTRRQTV